MDPFRYDMFNPKINFVSDMQSDEESMDVSDEQSDDSTFADAMSTLEEVHGEESMNALSNTEEMYLLFGGKSNKETSISNLEGQHEEKNDAYYLDPFVASGIAHMPDDIIELLSSDDEEDRQVQEKEPSNAKEFMVNHHPIDVLL